MAIVLLSGNLQQFGDAGHFEADPSTWGFSGSRTTEEAFEGTHSLKETSEGHLSALFGNTIAFGQYASEIGKKYLAKARIRSKSANPPATPVCVFSIFSTLNGNTFTNFTTVAASGDVWVEIEARWTQAFITGNDEVRLSLYGDVFAGADLIDGGVCYIDKFEIYEYDDIEPPACTLLIDSAGTVSVNETAPGANNGSLTIAITGGTAPIEYSKDNGGTWQGSNVFAGLTSGIYQVKAREQDNPTCVSSQSFYVNQDGVAFDFTTIVVDESIAGANDGSIDVTVTGVGGPFTYSKDVGVTYQGGNVFVGLAPGTYTIVVKDATDHIVAKNVTVGAGVVLFEKVWWSKNPIPFSVNAPADWSTHTNFRMFCEVRVEDVAGSSLFISKIKQELFPAADNTCLFNLRQAFRNVFAPQPPVLNSSAITKLTERNKIFKTYVGQLENDEVVPIALAESLPSLVLYGGLSMFANASIDYFGAYIIANKKFLTWAPMEKTVDLAQEDYLNYWIFDPNTRTLKFQIKAYYDDATDETSIVSTLTGVTYGELYQLPAGPANSGVAVIDAAKNLVKYEVSLLDQDNLLVSEVRIFKIAELRSPYTKFFMFINSLGAFEVHLFKGLRSKENQIDKQVVQKYLPPVYAAEQGQFESTEATFQQKQSISSGYFTGAYAQAWQEYLTDLILSKKVFDVTKGNRLPMTISTKNIPVQEDANFQHFVRFEALSAYQDPAYTPDL